MPACPTRAEEVTGGLQVPRVLTCACRGMPRRGAPTALPTGDQPPSSRACAPSKLVSSAPLLLEQHVLGLGKGEARHGRLGRTD